MPGPRAQEAAEGEWSLRAGTSHTVMLSAGREAERAQAWGPRPLQATGAQDHRSRFRTALRRVSPCPPVPAWETPCGSGSCGSQNDAARPRASLTECDRECPQADSGDWAPPAPCPPARPSSVTAGGSEYELGLEAPLPRRGKGAVEGEAGGKGAARPPPCPGVGRGLKRGRSSQHTPLGQEQ